MGRRLGSAAAAAAVATTLALVPSVATGQSRSAHAPRVPAAATHLAVQVQLSRTRVRIGHRLRVTYRWSDGNGQLVDTNRVGTMATRVLRNVPCSARGAAPRPSSGRGHWWYRPQTVFTGAYDHPVTIDVGFNVRTGGCAPIEEETATQRVTVLPAATP